MPSVDEQKKLVIQLKKDNPEWKSAGPDAPVTQAISLLKKLIAAEKANAKGKPAAKPAAPAARTPASGMGAVAHKKTNVLAIQATKQLSSFSDWYAEVIAKAGLVTTYPISGCYVLRPEAYAIWESIQSFFDGEIKKMGVKNVYFPMFVTEEALMREKDHVEGFSPEVAWITKCGQAELKQKIAIRPTSETVMYPVFAQWINSHRDLPLQVNQWCNVVRWEFKSPTPFIRTREFLWQEGHTAYADKASAEKEVYDINELYARVYRELLAVPCVRGKKSAKEKFAGADFTTTVEIYTPVVGRGIQGATSHHLGQNFSKMFNIDFSDKNGDKAQVFQNSWGMTTRTIGAMILQHSDDRGLVLPPRVAPIQVVLIPIVSKKDNRDAIESKLRDLHKELLASGIRAELDLDDLHTPGFKRSEWEVRGVPIRLELGPKDIAKESVLAARRETGAKTPLPWRNLAVSVLNLLEDIQSSLYERALAVRKENIVRCEKWDDGFMASMDSRKLAVSPWCDTVECETAVNKRTKEEAGASAEQVLENEEGGEQFEVLTGAAKTLCIPLKGELDDAMLAVGKKAKCFACGKQAKVAALWGRSY